MTNIEKYIVKFEAHNVSDKQRELIYKTLEVAFDAIFASDLITEKQDISIGETNVTKIGESLV